MIGNAVRVMRIAIKKRAENMTPKRYGSFGALAARRLTGASNEKPA